MKATRKLIPALAMLIVAAVVMSTASYAWFTMSRNVTATGMEVAVTAPNNLVIAGSENSTYTEFSATGKTLVADAEVVPASTSNAKDFFVVDGSGVNANGSYNDNTKFKAGSAFATAGTAGAYVDFRFDIKTEGTEAIDVWVKACSVKTETTADKTKPVRFAVLNASAVGTAATNATVVGQYKPVAAAANFGGNVLSAATPATATAAYKTPAAALSSETNGSFQLASTGSTTIYIRVWYEGQDTACVMANRPQSGFSLEVEFASAKHTEASPEQS